MVEESCDFWGGGKWGFVGRLDKVWGVEEGGEDGGGW